MTPLSGSQVLVSQAMKANRTPRNEQSDRAEIGIGTMIVFIAAVIVAAIAAAVLVNTAGNLERKASDTGRETTDQVSSNIFVDDILGQVEEDAQQNRALRSVNYTLSLAPGANPIDLESLTIRYHTNDTVADLSFRQALVHHSDDTFEDADAFAGGGGGGGGGGAAWQTAASCYQQGLSCGFSVVNITEPETGNDVPVLEPGDRVKLHIDLGDEAAAALSDQDMVYPNTAVNSRFMPQTGAPVTQGFTAPSSFSGDTWIILR